MNLMLLALAFLFLTQGNLFNPSPQKGREQGSFDDSNAIFSLLGKLNNGKGLDIQTLLELLSNPAVAGILSSLLGKKKEEERESETSCKETPFEGEKQKDTYTASSGKEQKSESQLVKCENEKTQEERQPHEEEFFSPKPPIKEHREESEKTIDIYSREKQEREEFFAPVAEIATTKVSRELYNIYDNWYTKKGK